MVQRAVGSLLPAPAFVLALGALGGCGEPEPEPEPEPDAAAFADEEKPLRDVFIARNAADPLGPVGQLAPSRLALFHGHYAVANGGFGGTVADDPLIEQPPERCRYSVIGP